MSKLVEEFGAKMAAQAAEEKIAEAEAKAAEKARNQALRLLARGRDTVEEIAEITELSVEEVEQLAKETGN